jgi:hypothetical protein
MCENLVGQAIYNTTIKERGMRLNEVKEEFIFFIVEVVEKGKYVRAWCCRASGGADLHINGQQISCWNMN